jgi:redox-sensing transcriptional repressor
MSVSNERRIPEATVARLPEYLRLLTESLEAGVLNLSSDELADMAGVNAAKVRKDLSYLGTYGVRGVGYDVEYLIYQVRRELGLDHDWPVVIVGAGNLGQALAGYGGFRSRGFPIAGIFDLDPSKVGTYVGDEQNPANQVRSLEDLPTVVAAGYGGSAVSIGVVATPASAAQDAADLLVKAGVTSILNFAPILLSVPASVSVRKVDLAVELQILSYYEQRRSSAAS